MSENLETDANASGFTYDEYKKKEQFNYNFLTILKSHENCIH